MTQTHREYLQNIGLLKPGQRGRLPAEGIVVLTLAVQEGEVFSDWNIDGPIKPEKTPKPRKTGTKSVLVAPEARKFSKVREENAFRITSPDGETLITDFCSKSHSLSICSCSNPVPPNYMMDPGSEVEMIVREM